MYSKTANKKNELLISFLIVNIKKQKKQKKLLFTVESYRKRCYRLLKGYRPKTQASK